jgi:hypothetical protein
VDGVDDEILECGRPLPRCRACKGRCSVLGFAPALHRLGSCFAHVETFWLKALSIRQPWAWLIVTGQKDIENRTCTTRYRGPLLIHAGRAWARIPIDDIEKRYGVCVPRDKFLGGGIIGTADLVEIVTKHGSVWFDGAGYGWVLKNPRPLAFKPLDGALGLFHVDWDGS